MVTDLLIQLKPWLIWLHVHPGWVFIVAFLLTFIECLAVVGLVVPGTVFMTALGALVGSKVVSAKIVLSGAFLGSFLGDVTSFFIGYHYRDQLRIMWPFKFYPRLLQKGETFFYRHGGKGVFIGRFVGPIRPLLPIIAGMLNMKPWRFLLADSISAVFWAPVYMFPGIILGAASIELPPEVAMHLMLYVILALLVLWCISWGIKRFIAWLFSTLHDLLDKLWAMIKHKPFLRLFNIVLQDPLHPESHAQLTLALYFILFASSFVFLSWDVLHQGLFTLWNTPLLFLLRSLHGVTTANVMLVFTLIGEPKVWMGVWVVILLWLVVMRAWRTVLYWGLLGALGFGGGEIIKQLIHSPRPTGLFVTPSGYSFPSGHTVSTTIVGGFFAVLLSRELSEENRWIPYTLATLSVLCIGFSRLYLGAHWLTDVVGGMLLGIAVVMFVTLSYFRRDTPKLSPILFSLVFLVSWGVIGTLYAVKHYAQNQKDYALYIPAKTSTVITWWNDQGMNEPLYRASRVGKPSQVLNIQWVGNLGLIEESLQGKGWNIAPNTTLGLVLARLSESHGAIRFPVLSQLYLEEPPVLVMTKPLTGHLLVLRLWDGRTQFTDSDLPLWVGNVDYYNPSKVGLFHHAKVETKTVVSDVPAVKVFEQDLEGYTWKQLSYTPEQRQKLSPDLAWDGQVVMVRSREEKY
ncbi:MAG TPA: phosphatase PAP2 family protein [Gammaproteobacteria bacterium]|nr:phosphatase PAP2 family protein [Gammaproteobacteria bacterium]